MLPSAHRITSGDDFRAIRRRGFRQTTPFGVVFVASGSGQVSRCGFVVSKAVGNAVVRNRVKRRFRAACAVLLDHVGSLVSGPIDVVVRADASAAAASVDELVDGLTGVISRYAIRGAGARSRGDQRGLDDSVSSPPLGARRDVAGGSSR